MSRTMYVGLTVTGCADADGKRYFVIKDREKKQEWLAGQQIMSSDPKSTIQALNEQGMPIGGAAYVGEILEATRKVSNFPPREVVARAGWIGTQFARPDGEVLLPKVSGSIAAPPAIGFRREPDRYRCTGKLAAWKRRVSQPLSKDAAATFLIGLALAPTIRPLFKRIIPPFIVQLITDQQHSFRSVALSVIGSSSEEKLATDPISKLLADPPRLIDGSRDSLLMIGDVSAYLCGEAGKKRPAALLALVNDHLLPSGGGEASAAGNATPCALFIEGRPLAEQLELKGGTAARIEEAIVTIKLDPGALEGLRHDIDRISTPSRVWSGAVSAAADHSGVALHRFQRRLVERREKVGITRFEAELNADFDRFCASCDKKYGEGSVPTAMVELFALTEAALMAAERLHVLPKELEHPRSEAVWRVFKHALSERPRPKSAADILNDIADREGVRNINDLKETDGKDELEHVPAFIKVKKDGSRELWVPTSQKKLVFVWRAFKKLPDYTEWYCGKGEEDRDGEKRKLGAWHTRVLRFHLPRP